MGRGRDNREYGADASAGTGPVSRHADATAVGVARHLGSRSRMRAWLKVTTAVVTILVVGGLGFAGYWYFRLQSNITTAPLNAGGTANPEADKSARMQILILGSDTRDGANAEYGSTDDSTGYGKSDVMMLMDVSADNKRVSVISFPRDLLVDIPECTDQKTKRTYPARSGVMINEAMNEAGIGCAVDTVNKLTGLEIDHFMMADFTAVKELSNTVGGVDVCISDAVYDPDSRLRLPKGTSSVKGEMALAFLRTRHAFADGGDLGRIHIFLIAKNNQRTLGLRQGGHQFGQMAMEQRIATQGRLRRPRDNVQSTLRPPAARAPPAPADRPRRHPPPAARLRFGTAAAGHRHHPGALASIHRCSEVR